MQGEETIAAIVTGQHVLKQHGIRRWPDIERLDHAQLGKAAVRGRSADGQALTIHPKPPLRPGRDRPRACHGRRRLGNSRTDNQGERSSAAPAGQKAVMAFPAPLRRRARAG